MPLPTPEKNESKDNFLDRCMGDETMNQEYPDQDQRYAVCNSQWDGKSNGDAQQVAHTRVINAIQAMPWAIRPEILDVLVRVVIDGQHRVLDDSEKRKKKISQPSWEHLDGTRDTFVTDGVAILPIVGVMSKRMNLFDEISGGTSMEMVQRDLQIALQSKDVKSILLDIDSPGGTVDGTKALADAIFASRTSKPIIAFANGEMCSAAYWIGSSANKIIAEETATIGSIGVVMVHYDLSQADAKFGVKRTYLTSGKYKAVGNDAEPLSREDKAYLQSFLDHYYSVFVNGISQNRGVSTETVLKDMADGRIFVGKQALTAGLVDEIGSFNFALNVAKAMTVTERKTEIFMKGETDMKLADLKQNDPEGFAALVKDVQDMVKIDTEALQSQIADQNKVIAEQTKTIASLEKKNALQEENARKEKAEHIWTEELTMSDIPAHLHSKVRNQVNYLGFVTKEGVFDEAAFTNAVRKEISDGWPTAQVIGGGVPLKSIEDSAAKTEKEDSTLTDSLFSMAESSKLKK